MDLWSASCDGRFSENFVERTGEFFTFTGKECDAIEADSGDHKDQCSFRDERIDAGLELRLHKDATKNNDRDNRQAGEPGWEDDSAREFPATEICFARSPRPEREPAEEERGDQR